MDVENRNFDKRTNNRTPEGSTEKSLKIQEKTVQQNTAEKDILEFLFILQ